MKVFLVNLDRDKDRLANANEQLVRLGIAYERIPAVYGKGLSVAEKRRAVNRFRWWCAIGRPISDAEIGCALSHQLIYRRMISESIPCACIFEDDIVLNDRICQVLEMVEKHMDPAKSQVVMLSDHTGMYANDKFETMEIRRSGSAMCTDGYCITKTAATKLLQCNCPIITPCDLWGRWATMGRIDLYHALPSVCKQDQRKFGSSTTEGRVAVSGLPWFLLALHKTRRCVGKMLDWALLRFRR